MTISNRRLMTFAICLLAVGGLVVDSPTSAAEGAPAAKSKPAAASLDDELFKDLSDGLPDAKPKPAQSKPAQSKPAESKPAESKPDPTRSETTQKPSPKETSAGATQPLDPLDRKLFNELEDDASADAAGDPLKRLTERVRDAERRLRRTDSGDQTQELQRRIVDDLEKLIAQIEQQKSKQKTSQSKGPPKGAPSGQKKPGEKKPGNTPGNEPNPNPTDSSDQLTAKKAEKPTSGKLKEMLEKVWGNLPERERQDVMQSSFEDFPAKYQFGIEQYFKTLLKRRD